MSKQQHTPGPWRLRHDRQIVGPNGRSIARAHQDTRFRSDEETAANGLVLAAAPDLLEALEKIIELADASPSAPYPAVARVFDSARAAIAKAKGEQA